MFWTILQNAVNVVFLAVGITLLTILWSNTQDLKNDENIVAHFELFKKETQKVMINNINYVETRINKLSETQDSYQVVTSSRLSILEKKLEKIEKENKQQNKIVNNNISSAVINGIPQEQ